MLVGHLVTPRLVGRLDAPLGWVWSPRRARKGTSTVGDSSVRCRRIPAAQPVPKAQDGGGPRTGTGCRGDGRSEAAAAPTAVPGTNATSNQAVCSGTPALRRFTLGVAPHGTTPSSAPLGRASPSTRRPPTTDRPRTPIGLSGHTILAPGPRPAPVAGRRFNVEVDRCFSGEHRIQPHTQTHGRLSNSPGSPRTALSGACGDPGVLDRDPPSVSGTAAGGSPSRSSRRATR
jgi:hypothetical protein